MPNQDFDRCMEQMRRGDAEGLREIYEAYISFIFGIMSAVCGGREEAEDLAADFFVKLYESAAGYRLGGGHRTWMARMARNMALDRLRKRSREMPMDEIQEYPGDSPSAEDEALPELSFEERVSGLPEDRRSILCMRLSGGLSFREIAGIMELPLGTVTWKYQDSIKILRRAMA